MWQHIEQQMLQADSFKVFFTNILQCFNEQQLITFAMTSWSLWRKRNTKLWENKVETVMQVINKANYTLEAWNHANNKAANRMMQAQPDQQLHWQPPPAEYLKCNIDAAQENKVSMKACLRDKSGSFVAAFSCHDSGMYSAAGQRRGDFTKGLNL
jgi:hypothetical protein